MRQNPKLGLFYVGDLKKVAVGSYEEIDRRIEEGTANRTVASTQMNATSSRAHTVVTIEFTQKKMVDGNEMAKQSGKWSQTVLFLSHGPSSDKVGPSLGYTLKLSLTSV